MSPSWVSCLTYIWMRGWEESYHQATGLDAWASRVKCHIYMRYVYIYIWVVYSLCFFCCLFITVTWWYVWCFEWASGNQEEVQACLVTLWLFIISCYSLYKTTHREITPTAISGPRFTLSCSTAYANVAWYATMTRTNTFERKDMVPNLTMQFKIHFHWYRYEIMPWYYIMILWVFYHYFILDHVNFLTYHVI